MCLPCSALHSRRQCFASGRRSAAATASPPAGTTPMRHPLLDPGAIAPLLSCSERATASPSTRWLPPHRRRGEPTTEPQTSISRAHQHYQGFYILFFYSSCQFPNSSCVSHYRLFSFHSGDLGSSWIATVAGPLLLPIP
jgi:hypothetical protein